MRRTSLAYALLLLGALTGCGDDPTTSAPLAERYVLVSVDGATAPLLIGEHTFEGGERQTYTIAYDVLRFTSDTAGSRRFELRVDTYRGTVALQPPLSTRFEYATEVSRRGSRVIVGYLSPTGTQLRPDTFTVREGALVRRGSFGVVCDGCPPPRRVEYRYEAR
jgi:hypothetical protein